MAFFGWLDSNGNFLGHSKTNVSPILFFVQYHLMLSENFHGWDIRHGIFVVFNVGPAIFWGVLFRAPGIFCVLIFAPIRSCVIFSFTDMYSTDFSRCIFCAGLFVCARLYLSIFFSFKILLQVCMPRYISWCFFPSLYHLLKHLVFVVVVRCSVDCFLSWEATSHISLQDVTFPE